MNTTYLKKNLIMRGAALAHSEHLCRLERAIVGQQSVSTHKLEKHLEAIRERHKDDAHLMSQALEAIRELEHG